MPAYESALNYRAAMKAKFDIDEVKKGELASAAKIGGASTLRNVLKKLKDNGLVVREGAMIKIASKGMDAADTSEFDNIKVATTNDDKQRSLFDALADGHIHDKEELREALGLPKNQLVKIKVAWYPDSKSIQLTKAMFPVIPRPE